MQRRCRRRKWCANNPVALADGPVVRRNETDIRFLTPEEVTTMLETHGLEVACMRGSRPRFGWALWRMLLTGRVGEDFAFTFTPSTKIGFTGYARKVSSARRSSAAPPPSRASSSAIPVRMQ